METAYSNDDQEFFFRISNEILDRFHLLDNIHKDALTDVILFYSDCIVNQLDLFKSTHYQLFQKPPIIKTYSDYQD
jgi:hypothetical protein